jgi:hypothetical protein
MTTEPKQQHSEERMENTMHEDATLPDWDRDPRKFAALDARLQELIMLHTAADPRWDETLLTLSDDVTSADQVPEAFSAFCRYITNLVLYMYGGQDEAVKAMTDCLSQLRRIAAEGVDE